MTDPATDPAEHYRRLHAIFDRARDLTDPARERFLDERCGHDPELRAEVVELLANLEQADSDALSESGVDGVRERLEGLLDEGRPEPTWLPEAVGRYRILNRIGQGGMGVVYEAEQESPHRRVAVKLLTPQTATPERERRLRQEAELLGRLHHPGIAQIYEAGSFDVGNGDQPFFAMELIDGVGLRLYADRERLDVRTRLELVAQAADAVHHAHERGVIHRDLKPDNVMVDARGQPKVLDFGVARAGRYGNDRSSDATLEGVLLGTLTYMAPEQLSGEAGAVTARSDVYALGVTAYELVSGRLPHDVAGLPMGEALRTLSEGVAPRLGALDPRLAGDVETLIGKAIDKDPARRYETAAALAADIRRFLGNEPIAARPPSGIYRARKFARRHRGLVGGLVATGASLALGLAVSINFALEARHESRELGKALVRESAALEQEQLARAAEGEARAREQVAFRRSESHRMALQSMSVGADDPGLALLLALEANASERIRESTEALYLAIQSLHERRSLWHDGSIHHLEVSPDRGQFATCVSNGQIYLWDAATLERLHVFDAFRVVNAAFQREIWGLSIPHFGQRFLVQTTGFGPRGQRLFAAALDGTAVVWDVATGTQLARFVHDAPLRCAVLGEDRLWAGAQDGKLLAWRLDDPAEPEVLADFEEPLVSIAVDGERIAAIGHSDRVRVFEAGSEVLDLQPPEVTIPPSMGETRGWERAGEVALRPDGRLLIRRRREALEIRDLEDGSVALALPREDGQVLTSSWSPSGRWLVVHRHWPAEAHAELWDVQASRRISLEDFPTYEQSHGARFDEAEELALITTDEALQVVELRTGRLRASLNGHRQLVRSGDFLPGGRVVSGSSDNLAKLWELEAVPELTGGLGREFKLLATGRHGFEILDEPRVRVLDLETGAAVIEEALDGPVRRRAFDLATQRLAVADSAGTLTAWNLASGERLHRLPGVLRGDPQEPRLAFAPDGTTMVVGDRRLGSESIPSRIARIDLESGALLWETEHDQDLVTISVSPDGRHVVTSNGRDRSFSLLDPEDGSVSSLGPGRTAWTVGTGFSPDGQRFAAVAVDSFIALYATDDWQRNAQLRNMPTLETDLSWSPDGTRLAASYNGQLDRGLVHDTTSGERLFEIATKDPRGVSELHYHPNGHQLAMRVGDRVQLLPLDPVAYGRQVTDRRLIASEKISFRIGSEAELASQRERQLFELTSDSLISEARRRGKPGAEADLAVRLLEQALEHRPRVVEHSGYQWALAKCLGVRAAQQEDPDAARAEVERALVALRTVAEMGGYGRDYLEAHADLEPLRDEPGFRQLMEELGP